MRDCVFLVADSNMAETFKGFLGRDQFHLSLGTGSFRFDAKEDLVVDEGGNDPGVYTRGHELLRSHQRSHHFAVVVLDKEWDGSPGAAQIEAVIRANMIRTGWQEERFAVVVIDPELENWIWQDNVNVDAALGFKGPGTLRDFLKATGDWPEGVDKPIRPKETVEAVLRISRTPRSSAVYGKISKKVSVKTCKDVTFQGLVEVLRGWFPPEAK